MDETGSLLCQAVLENWPVEQKETIVATLIKDTVKLCSSQWATFVVLQCVSPFLQEYKTETDVIPPVSLSMDE